MNILLDISMLGMLENWSGLVRWNGCLHHERGTATSVQCSRKKLTYESRKEKAAKSWARLRKGLLTSLIELCCHPLDLQCCMCAQKNHFKYLVYVLWKLHTNVNIHAPVMWEPQVNIVIPCACGRGKVVVIDTITARSQYTGILVSEWQWCHDILHQKLVHLCARGICSYDELLSVLNIVILFGL